MKEVKFSNVDQIRVFDPNSCIGGGGESSSSSYIIIITLAILFILIIIYIKLNDHKSNKNVESQRSSPV